jgi:hypothetical protein
VTDAAAFVVVNLFVVRFIRKRVGVHAWRVRCVVPPLQVEDSAFARADKIIAKKKASAAAQKAHEQEVADSKRSSDEARVKARKDREVAKLLGKAGGKGAGKKGKANKIGGSAKAVSIADAAAKLDFDAIETQVNVAREAHAQDTKKAVGDLHFQPRMTIHSFSLAREPWQVAPQATVS